MKIDLETIAVSLPIPVENANALMIKKGYSKRTIENYHAIWILLVNYADEEGILSYTANLIVQFARSKYNVCDVFHPTSDREKRYARILLCLNDLFETGIWTTKHIYNRPKHFQSKALAKVFDHYTGWLNEKQLMPGSITLKREIARDFLHFIESRQINDISEIDLSIVQKYLRIKEKYSASTKSGIIITLRSFFRCPSIAISLKKDLSINLKASNNNGKYERLPSSYNSEEISSVLSCINRSESSGIKDYAIILLAADTGMRVSDIINLKLSNIKWDAEAIEIIQKKTGVFISLPMSDAVKWALLDYLTNVRPKDTDCENVFLRSHAPMTHYDSAGHFYKKVNKYFSTAGINTQGKHHGMHSLRHSLATRLLRNDISITVIAQALGHKYGNVTNQYIRIDIDQLRHASLEVPSNE